MIVTGNSHKWHDCKNDEITGTGDPERGTPPVLALAAGQPHPYPLRFQNQSAILNAYRIRPFQN